MEKTSKWLSEKIPEPFNLVVVIVILLSIVALYVYVGHSAFEYFKEHASELPIIATIFICSIIFSIFILSLFFFIQWKFKMPTEISKTKSWFNPNNENSPLKDYFSNMKNVESKENPFTDILKKDDGLLPLSLNQLQSHISNANTLANTAQSHLSDSTQVLTEIANFKKWGDTWQNQAVSVITKMERLKNIIASPDDYIKFLNSCNSKESHIKIMGSMAGFLCLFPLSMRNFICAFKGNVTIDLIGTGVKVGEHNLALYPLAFISKTMVALFDLCEGFQNTQRRVVFNIYHYPYDIIEAIFIISDKKLINVQSLSPNNIDVVFDNGQLGLVFSKDENQELFDRYDKSFGHIKDKLEKQTPKPKETWELYKDENSKEWNLIINGRGHWNIKNENIVFAENEELFDLDVSKHGTKVVKEFLYRYYDDSKGIYKNDDFSTKVRFLKNETPKLHEIDKVLRDKPNLSQMPCSCGWENYKSITT